MKIETKTYQTSVGEITYVTLTNGSGASVTLSNLGAGIVSIIVPDRDGKLADVVLGYSNPADYLADGPCVGKITGRYANRIARGRFSIDGNEYNLAINNGLNALQGGPTGFANRIWSVAYIGEDEVQFAYRSTDGEEGYPGNLDVKATYRWTEDNVLELYLSATTDKPTVVKLTNHAYFNLEGHNAGSVLDEYLWLNASRYLPKDDTLIPTGEMAPVAGTPMDFTKAKPLGQDIKLDFPALNYGKGYDNCWVINDWEKGVMNEAAVLASHRTGRQLSVFTTQPAVQVYTGNWLDGCPAGKDGAVYHDYDGVAIECQGMPDAPNHPNSPSQVLRPGEEYEQLIFLKFSTT